MGHIDVKMIRDENERPVAVQIPYIDWVRIEGLLPPAGVARENVDLNRYRGILQFDEDPVALQRRLRAEWDREEL